MIQKFLELLYQTTMLQWLIAFAGLTLTDIAWARYTASTSASSNPHVAARWAVVLFGLGGSVVVQYTTNPVLLIPAAAGAYAGTYLGVRLTKRIEK